MNREPQSLQQDSVKFLSEKITVTTTAMWSILQWILPCDTKGLSQSLVWPATCSTVTLFQGWP